MDKCDALVIGGGPAGLMAASVLAKRGLHVVVAEQMPTVGRKFLMAGKSGLNLSKIEALENFLAAYSDGDERLSNALRRFGPSAIVDWAEGLGEPTFTGSTGRLFPVAMKASGLLRKWLVQLDHAGVDLRTRWRWTGWDGDESLFDTPDGARRMNASIVVLGTGGGSWRRLGSDGTWTRHLNDSVAPFEPSNVGFVVPWSAHMPTHFGAEVKGVRLSAGEYQSRGEWIVSKRGIEGGGVYEVSRAVRDGAPLELDLFPETNAEALAAKLGKTRTRDSLSNRLRKGLDLTGVRRALLFELSKPVADNRDALARRMKALPVPVSAPYPLDEAISTAGGVRWDALDGFMLRDRPGTFVAGEMIAWDAPTGGYLLTACLATGRAAAISALDWLDQPTARK